MNVLIEFGSGAEDFDDEVYTDLLDLLIVDKCVLLYNNKEKLSSRKICKYVTQAIFAPPLVRGDYKDAIQQVGLGEPLDDDILNKMAPYENEVIAMLLRWSQREYVDIWHDYCSHVRFWSYVLDLYAIDAYFTPEIPHAGYNYIIYLLCKVKDIKFFSTQKISFPERLHIAVGVHDQLPFFIQEYNKASDLYKNLDVKDIKLNSCMQEMYDFYTGCNDRTPYYMRDIRSDRDNSFMTRLYITRNFFYKYIRAICIRLKFLIDLGCRICFFDNRVNDLFLKYEVSTAVYREAETFLSYYNSKATWCDYSQKYIYVPLHYQPEQTTSPLGGKFVDQLLMIKILSYYLPKGWYLYVKEHPSYEKYMGTHRETWRTKQFYDELYDLPNVKLINLSEDTYKLIEKSVAVAIVTGTAGLEAITVRKTCLMFGYSYLQYAPNVIAIRNNNDCKRAMDKLLKGIDDTDLDKKIKIYFKVLEKYMFKGCILWYDAKHRLNYSKDREESKQNIINAYIKEIKRICGKKVLKY